MRQTITIPDALHEAIEKYRQEKGLQNWTQALIEIAANVLNVDVALPSRGGARPGSGQKPGGKMDHKAIVEAYFKFWPVAVDAKDYYAAKPVIVALKTLNQANRQLFPDRESLVEVVAGAVMDECNARSNMPAVMAFAEAFVSGLPQSWINDPSEAIGRHAKQLIAMYARMAKQGWN